MSELTVGAAPAVPAPRRRGLADAEVAVLVEAMPGLPLPADLLSGWSPELSGEAQQAARRAAWESLAASGVLTGVPGSVAELPRLVNRAVLEALALPATATLVVGVRSWAREVAFAGRLAVDGDRGSGVVRRFAVRGGERTPEPGLELSAFAAESLLDEVLRVLPPSRVGVPAEEASGVDLRAVDSAAVVAAVREGRTAVADELARQAGLDGVPAVLEDLALRREGGAEVSLARPDGLRPPVVATWWLAGGRWWRALSAPAQADEPLRQTLRLRPTSREEARDDLLLAMTGLLAAQDDGDAEGAGRG